MHKNRKIKKGILKGALLMLFLLLTVFIINFYRATVEHPPKAGDLSSLQLERIETDTNKFFYGNNWLRKSKSGLYEMYLEGGPFERGVAFGKLTRELLYYQEEAFVEQIRRLVPSEAYLKFLKYFVGWFSRDLGKHIPEEYLLEIYGTSFSSSPAFDFIGTGYQRQLNYHAAHDIGHALQALKMTGCTSFSFWGGKSSDSTLVTARNFDFYAGQKFAENKIIVFCNPESGLKFMMITWADMIGVVSGMNEKGLTVTINAARSAIPLKATTPVTILAREILQYAGDIAQAVSISEKRKLFVSESLLISSAADGKTVIIEKSPKKFDVVFPQNDQIICANHFQGSAFSDDKTNIENIYGSDSRYRFERVGELLGMHDKVSVRDAAAILRDRKGRGGTDPGMGNPLAINQLIAHHSVIFSPSDLLVWISAGPYQLGEYVAYDLKKVFSGETAGDPVSREISEPDLSIPADTFLFSADYSCYGKYLKMTGDLGNYTRNHEKLPESFETAYIETNPMFYLVYSNLGNYFYENRLYEKANEYYQMALSKDVAGEDERNKLLKLTEKVHKKLGNVHSRN